MEQLAEKLHIRRLPELRLTNASLSPMLLFLGGRAQLILPVGMLESLDPHQRRAVLAHELAHLHRGDHWVRLFELFATAVLWWHPLLWLARFGLRDAEEQCCDAWVVSVLPDSRRRYADALVDAMELASRWTLPACASGLGRLSSLRRRLTMIVNAGTPKSLSPIGKLSLIALLAAIPLAPVRGQNKDSSTRPAANPATASVNDSTRKALDALLENALDPNEQVKQAAVQAILRFGKQAAPVLLDAMSREKTAELAEGLLTSMGADGVDALLQAARSNDPDTRARDHGALEQVLQNSPGQGCVGFVG